MWPVIQLLGFTIPVGSLFAVLTFAVGSELGARAMGRIAADGQNRYWRDWFGTAAFLAAAAGVIGARLAYALQYRSLYISAPEMLFSFRPGTLAVVPGLVIGGLTLVLYLRRKGIPLAYIADASAVGAVGGLLIWQIRQFLIGLDYGAPTGMPWGLNQWGVMRHPVQLYGAVVLAAILWFLWRYVNAAMPGEPFWLAVALLGLETLLLDVFRADPDTTWGGIRIGQVIALATLVAALYVLSFYRRQPIEAAEAE